MSGVWAVGGRGAIMLLVVNGHTTCSSGRKSYEISRDQVLSDARVNNVEVAHLLCETRPCIKNMAVVATSLETRAFFIELGHIGLGEGYVGVKQ